MSRKILLIITAALLLLPIPVTLADSTKNYSFTEAVNEAYRNDLSLQIKEVPELSAGVQIYQLQLPLSGLEDAMDIQKEYQDLSREWTAELNAYRTIYDFITAREGLKISERSLNQAQSDRNIVQKKRNIGVASNLDLLQAEISVTNAKKNYENAKMGYNIAERRVQQILGLELGQDEIDLTFPAFSLLNEEEYDPATVSDEMQRTHKSLRTIQYLIRTYKKIIDKIDDLQAIPSSGNISVENLKNLLISIESQLARLKEDPEANESEILQFEALSESLKVQIALITANSAQTPAPVSLSRAKRDLEEYYKAELHNAEIQLLQQLQALELLSYSYAEQFSALTKQIDLQEQAVQEAIELYQANRTLLENGMISPADLNALRLNVESTEFQLLQLKKDYMVLKKEFELFKEGYLPIR